MKKQDLEYLLETLNYGLNDCDDRNGNTETHFNSFANAINVVQDELNLLNITIVSTSLSLDNFIINPKDKDDDFEIKIEGDFQGDAYAYLNKEQAIKLAKYILKSFNVC